MNDADRIIAAIERQTNAFLAALHVLATVTADDHTDLRQADKIAEIRELYNRRP